MRRRERRDTIELPGRRVVEPAGAATARAARRLVDDALREYSGRELVDRVDALRRLHAVGSTVLDLPTGARIVEIVGAADRAWADRLVVSQAAVVDALLDVRSALAA